VNGILRNVNSIVFLSLFSLTGVGSAGAASYYSGTTGNLHIESMKVAGNGTWDVVLQAKPEGQDLDSACFLK